MSLFKCQQVLLPNTHSFPILLSTQTAAMLSVSFSVTCVNSCAAAVPRKETGIGLRLSCQKSAVKKY